MPCQSKRRSPPARTLVLLFACAGMLLQAALAQGNAIGGEPARQVLDEGIPIKNALVLAKCGSCHQPDAEGNLTRISYIRTTPEGWEEAIKRMVRLNGLQIDSSDARAVLRYLSDSHGLAPEEARPIQYFVEHRLVDEKVPEAQRSCASCHAIAKPLSWRRTSADWDLLRNMHVAFFPYIEDFAFRRPEGANTPGPDGQTPKQPVETALDFIKASTTLMTPEWGTWEATMHSPKLQGDWLVSGTSPGKGKFFGAMTIEPNATSDGFTTKTSLSFVNGQTLTEAGSSVVYTGYAWRGRSKSQSSSTAVGDPQTVREVMMLEKDESGMTGRWFWGAYEEFGMNVSMRRSTGGPVVLGVDVSALKAGSTDNPVRIFGSYLPADLVPSDVDLGPGVQVSKIVSQTPTVLSVLVTVDKAAAPGTRLVAVKSVSSPATYAVFDHIDYIKVTPETSLAHLGGQPHAKGYQQFEALAFANGPDGKPNTSDDIPLGPVSASWKMEEFIASYGDDDVDFVGSLDPKTGLFVPASEGPNPKRRSMRNNYGDVWAVATYQPDAESVPLIGRSYLIVAVPQYVQWDQPEVEQ